MNNIADRSKVDTRTEYADTTLDTEAVPLRQHELLRGSTTSVDNADDGPESSRVQKANNRGRSEDHLLSTLLK